MDEAAGRTMGAGRETDRRVAERVMGYTVALENENDDGSWMLWDAGARQIGSYQQNPHWCWDDVPAFSEEIGAAWLIVEHFLARRRNVFLTADCGWQSRPMTPHFAVEIEWMTWEPDAIEHSHASAVTMPLAICRAALLACGVERPDADTREVK